MDDLDTIGLQTLSKFAGDTFTATFNFNELLDAGVVITNAATFVDKYHGIDANTATILSGSPQVEEGGRRVLQKIAAGIAGNTYRLRARATCDNGDVVTLAGMLHINV